MIEQNPVSRLSICLCVPTQRGVVKTRNFCLTELTESADLHIAVLLRYRREVRSRSPWVAPHISPYMVCTLHNCQLW
jgi:hypothetical protein